ncbi:hypothetical protein BDB00DRAFT_113796 [Zychaea mexicana]|uniref:uncharacterized protein n=1 Tax=Zychaea mexicana TaxID=64656 RepID=UPI0022FEBDAE|nr:uncharacterized protein BDB00DRAFT_113796 [Zychaea mexicana]KAI9484774.1 hypothetical protein BDB00DRAFT_113796 [Zychaea mexicana]
MPSLLSIIGRPNDHIHHHNRLGMPTITMNAPFYEDHQQPLPMILQLPDELLSEIMLFAKITDRLRCALTCRAWYDHFEKYPYALWDTIETNDSWLLYKLDKTVRKNKALASAFGQYARHIKFVLPPSHVAYYATRALSNSQCHNIVSLDLSNVFQLSIQSFLETIRLSHKSLRVIRLIKGDVIAAGYLATIFNICHNLTHFTYVGRQTSPQEIREAPESLVARTFHLTSLYLEFSLGADIVHLPTLLANCPRLKNLQIHTFDSEENQQILELVTMHCSNLSNFVYHSWHNTVAYGKRNEFRLFGKQLTYSYRAILDPSTTPTDEGDDISVHQKDTTLLPWVLKSHMTVETMSVSLCMLRPTRRAMHLLGSLHFPQLRELKLHCLCQNANRSYPSSNLCSFLQASPNLELVHLFGLNSINNNVLKVLGQLERLEQLEVTLGEASMVTPQGIRWLFESTKTLRRVSFGGLTKYFTNQHLLATTALKHLYSLMITAACADISTSGLYQYTDKMRDSDIKILRLGMVPMLDDRTILAFNRLPNLCYLEIAATQKNPRSIGLAFDELVEARAKDDTHTLEVKYTEAYSSHFFTSAVAGNIDIF